SCSIARKVSLTKSRSTLPSMIWLSWPLRSSAADRCSRDSGKRALRREVMVGLINSVREAWVMAGACEFGESRLAPQLEHQCHGNLQRGAVEARIGGDAGRVEHRFQYLFDAQPAQRVPDRMHVAAQQRAAGPGHPAQLGERSLQIVEMADDQAAERQVGPRIGYRQCFEA